MISGKGNMTMADLDKFLAPGVTDPARVWEGLQAFLAELNQEAARKREAERQHDGTTQRRPGI
jgi:hypothetical protein